MTSDEYFQYCTVNEPKLYDILNSKVNIRISSLAYDKIDESELMNFLLNLIDENYK